MYFQHTIRFIPDILSIQTVNFVQRFTLFHVFFIYVLILSAYSQYMNKLMPCILSIPIDSFRIFRECTQIILNVWNGIIFFLAFKGILLKKKYACMQLDQRPTRNNQLFGPSLTKKFISSYSDNTRNDLQIRISRRIQIILTTNLGRNQGTRSLLLMRKKKYVENLVQVYL
jgi:hypothetical protein